MIPGAVDHPRGQQSDRRGLRAHILQHARFESAGFIDEWLASTGASISVTRFWESPVLPGAVDLDLLVVLGGPMGANDEASYPWLAEEKRFIRSAIDAGVPVLGICLGAQLMAASLGAPVYPGAAKEIGWFPARGAKAATGSFVFPDSIRVFHWHGDTFDLPNGAVRLASSELTPNQGFQHGRRAIALQCHPEMTPDVVEALIETCGAELVRGRFVQSAEELRGASADTYATANALMADVLEYLTAGR